VAAKSELEAQRITRTLKLVKPPEGAFSVEDSSLNAGLLVTPDHFAIRAFEATDRARDELSPVVGKVQRFTHGRQIANRYCGAVFVKVHTAGKAAANSQVRREPLARAPISHGHAAIAAEVVLGVLGQKHAVFAAFGACVASFGVHFAN
jgi:hypothetical protein